MKLTYRGIQYSEEIPQILTAVEHKEITYRGNSTRSRMNSKFPWIKYITQLVHKSESRSVYDPITFWYNHKRQFLEFCCSIDDVARLNEALNITLQIERTKALKQKPKTQLKYRGVVYYQSNN